jgi:hypothetical protein
VCGLFHHYVGGVQNLVYSRAPDAVGKHCTGLLVREKAKIHRSHERVFNGLVVGIYTMWFNSIVPPLHGFCVCMDVSMTSNLKFTVQRFAGWLRELKLKFTR